MSEAKSVPMLKVTDLKRNFDVAAPLLNRLLEGKGKTIVRAVDGVSVEIR